MRAIFLLMLATYLLSACDKIPGRIYCCDGFSRGYDGGKNLIINATSGTCLITGDDKPLVRLSPGKSATIFTGQDVRGDVILATCSLPNGKTVLRTGRLYSGANEWFIYE